MTKNRVIIFLIGFVILLANCKPENKTFDVFFEEERQNLISSTKEVITLLGLENFEVLVYARKSINNRTVSQLIRDTNWSDIYLGAEPPESPHFSFGENDDGTSSIITHHDPFGVRRYSDASKFKGFVREKEIINNYDPNFVPQNFITYDNFSILIIFEDISKIQEDRLIKILDSYIINIGRGDNIFIVSKDEFNKLE